MALNPTIWIISRRRSEKCQRRTLPSSEMGRTKTPLHSQRTYYKTKCFHFLLPFALTISLGERQARDFCYPDVKAGWNRRGKNHHSQKKKRKFSNIKSKLFRYQHNPPTSILAMKSKCSLQILCIYCFHMKTLHVTESFLTHWKTNSLFDLKTVYLIYTNNY